MPISNDRISMKNSVLTTSLVAVGLLSVPAAQAQRQDKPWSVSASVRGFYDDNVATTATTVVPGPQESFGLQFRPSISYYIDSGATSFSASYGADVRYYENRSDSTDYQHDATLLLAHSFSEAHKLSISEQFVAAQEPELTDAGTVFRSVGDNYRNTFRIGHEAELSRLISVEISYRNTYVDYEQDEADITRSQVGSPPPPAPPLLDNGYASFSSLLDRWEHRFGTDLRWQVQPQLRALVGYMYDIRVNTSDAALAGPTGGPGGNPAQRVVLPEERDSRSHFLYVGADKNFSPQLSGAVRVGAQYTEYPNSFAGAQNNVVNPYGDASISYEYRKDSSFTFGIRHDRAQTDVAVTGGNANPTLDAENTTLYGTLSHAFTARLQGDITARYRLSQFEDGAADNSRESYAIIGTSLEYAINPFLTAEAGYSFTRLDSDLANRSFSRNRVFIGLRATY